MNPEARAALLDHYDREGRDLPWRRDTDPYRILVSEMMLQQTRVTTVLEYYERWLTLFPDVEALANASEDEVLKAWEGLGYYRRARNLHRAAQVVRERVDSAFPDTPSGLRDLPGVGEYTAGAVASIAFGHAVPAVDGNVRRVFARIYDEPDPKPAWLRGRAADVVDPERPGDWNQALMELGATICVPRSPRCGTCPVAEWCLSRQRGTQADRPVPPKRNTVREQTFVVNVMEVAGRVLLERRPEAGLLGGMWAFPESPIDVATGPDALAAAVLGLARERGLEPVGEPRAIGSVAHRFSHLSATYLPWSVPVASADPPTADTEHGERENTVRWVDPRGGLDVALPRAQQKVLQLFMNDPMRREAR